jgi:hypothetical protein
VAINRCDPARRRGWKSAFLFSRPSLFPAAPAPRGKALNIGFRPEIDFTFFLVGTDAKTKEFFSFIGTSEKICFCEFF